MKVAGESEGTDKVKIYLGPSYKASRDWLHEIEYLGLLLLVPWAWFFHYSILVEKALRT